VSKKLGMSKSAEVKRSQGRALGDTSAAFLAKC
jgi:hypothetical protein